MSRFQHYISRNKSINMKSFKLKLLSAIFSSFVVGVLICAIGVRYFFFNTVSYFLIPIAIVLAYLIAQQFKDLLKGDDRFQRIDFMNPQSSERINPFKEEV